jgi:hypothetical protein
LKKHKIESIFVELTARLIQERPDDIRGFLSKELLSMKNNDLFFSKQDFEGLFDTFNQTKENTLDARFINEGLALLGLPAIELPVKPVTKAFFVEILNKHYNDHYKCQ